MNEFEPNEKFNYASPDALSGTLIPKQKLILLSRNFGELLRISPVNRCCNFVE